MTQPSVPSADTLLTARDGYRFSWRRAGKQFLAGVFSPVKKILENPIKAAIGIATATIVGVMLPVTIPLMMMGGLAFGGFKLAKGVLGAANHYVHGRTQAAETSFYDIGVGTSTVGLTLLARRRAAVAAAEAKATITGASRNIAAAEAQKLGLAASLRESTSLLTTRDGHLALWRNLVDPLKFFLTNNKSEVVSLARTADPFVGLPRLLPSFADLTAKGIQLFGQIPDCPVGGGYTAAPIMLAKTAAPHLIDQRAWSQQPIPYHLPLQYVPHYLPFQNVDPPPPQWQQWMSRLR